MSKINKNKTANIFTVLVIILSAAYLVITLSGGYNWFGYFLAIANLIAGPICLFGYIREVRKGIFKDIDENAVLDESGKRDS